MSLESRIDDLYKLPQDDFVVARGALAKTLSGDEARRVKALVKPTIVPWSVNQVHWHARDVYTRLLKAGEKLRDVQLSALKGRTVDLRGATTAHRQAVGEAVKAATRLSSGARARPDAEPLARMFEALSLQQSLPEPHGRFTKILQPQGFEALAGVAIQLPPPAERSHHVKSKSAEPRSPAPKTSAAELRERRQREQDAAMARRRHDAAVKAADAKVAQAQTLEARARADWERAKQSLDAAQTAAAELRAKSPN